MKAIAQQWNFMRILRLVLGIWGIYSSITDSQPLFGILGGILVVQVLLNIGCCGSRGCKILQNKNPTRTDIKETGNEEVRSQ
ncbi:hypothetical protein VB264_17090 [Arcicella aquatica]|uniref:DUF2892 domain-containing protein n=1 Tax=Arcicella aquatica TaxID=217141 RepID=A0ABU5QR07_9BACT|nr:hypothetical protein [Arcicella aquatica]MEA5259516.1 hypothetical protein [Arcicella aquatica]